jgi:hypothetical protein
MPTAIFHPGRVVVTASLISEIEKQGMEPASLVPYFDRHVTGDWGEVDPHDRKVNEDALKTGARILSAYDMPKIGRIWIITDAAYAALGPRPCTTVMFPSDY